MQRLPQERLNIALGCLANASAILDETLTYVRERKAFGKAIGSFQHNKFILADLVIAVETGQAYIDACIMAQTRRELSAVDAAKAKCLATEVQSRVLDACVQLHGGYGFMSEYRVARAWADHRINKIWGGSNEIMKQIIGRDLGL
jgi:alkylation response protein AidB-like acyl-CoA dehydrogenase